MSNPTNNKNFNDEALRINRQLKKDNDALKEELQSLWSDLSILEKQLANYKDEPTVGQWQEEREQQELRDEADHLRDEYRERGLSRGDFINKEYT